MFRATKGADRVKIMPSERLTQAQLEELKRSGAIITDDRRKRPLYFDGRFLTASDLTRDQNYFLSRQADLGRAGGMGVVTGLMVTRGTGVSTINISAGHGVTSAGEAVVVPYDLSLTLTDMVEIQRLNAAFGLSRIPNDPVRVRSGLFVVALRAVEYTANPITSYPTTINGNRSTNDGEIIEAVAVTLIPYLDESGSSDFEVRRASVAREIFVLNAARGLPVDALPLALIAVDDSGAIRWIDPWLVRREVGSNRSDILGLGYAPRALREAHFMQYDRQLDDVVAHFQGRRFSASSIFPSLPPGGRMPANTINATDFSQTYFPPEVDVELSLVPEDEILALIEDSLLLPPIDLTFSGEELESTSVLVMIPVPRARLRTLVNSLSSLTRPLLPAAPGLIAKRKPLEALRFFSRLPPTTIPVQDTTTPTDELWRGELARVDFVWYIRRRNLHTRVDVAGLSRPVVTNETEVERILIDRLGTLNLGANFGTLRERSSTLANAELVSLLSSPKFESPLLVSSAIRELETRAEAPASGEETVTLDRSAVLEVNERFADPQIGEGILRMETINPELREDAEVINTLAGAGVVPELDLLARELPEAEVTELTREIVNLSRGGETARINELVTNRVSNLNLGGRSINR